MKNMRFWGCLLTILFLLQAFYAWAEVSLDFKGNIKTEGGYDTNIFLDPQNAVEYNLPEAISSGYLGVSPDIGIRFMARPFWAILGYRGAFKFFPSAFNGGEYGGYETTHSPAPAMGFSIKRFDFWLSGDMYFYRIAGAEVLDFNAYGGGGGISYNYDLGSLVQAGFGGLVRGYTNRTTVDGELQRNIELYPYLMWRHNFRSYIIPSLMYRFEKSSSNELYSEQQGHFAEARLGTEPVDYFSAYGGYFFRHRTYLEERTDVGHGVNALITFKPLQFMKIFAFASYQWNISSVEWGGYSRLGVSLGVEFEGILPIVSPSYELEGKIFSEQLEEGYRFAYCGKERGLKVELVGDMNGWGEKKQELEYNMASGCYEALIDLAAGEYAYGFKVQGSFVTPENAEAYTPDGFGGKNALAIIRK